MKQGTGGMQRSVCLRHHTTNDRRMRKTRGEESVKNEAPPPFKLEAPIKVTVELQSSDMADRAMLLPGVSREGRKLSFTAGDMPEA